MVDPCLLARSELRHGLADDAELESSLLAHYGPALDRLRFRLIAVPLIVLEDYRLDDFEEHFESLVESDGEYDSIMLLCGEAPDWPWEDAEDRRLIARGYVEEFRSGRDVRPVIIDFVSMADTGTIYVVDGHHRTQAAHEAGVDEILAYEVVF